MNFSVLREKVKWWTLFFSASLLALETFIVLSYPVWKQIRAPRILGTTVLVLMIITFVCGMITIPKWQAFVAIAVLLVIIYDAMTF